VPNCHNDDRLQKVAKMAGCSGM